MKNYKVPMFLDVFSITKTSQLETEQAIIQYLSKGAGGFNYKRCAKYCATIVKGHHSIESLVSQCKGNGESVALIQNSKVLEIVAPKLISLDSQVFNFPKQTITLAPGIYSNLGPNFFFVENGVVKIFYLHARKSDRATKADLAGLAWGFKKEILDNDFLGMKADVMLVDVDRLDETNPIVNMYSLDELLPELIEAPEDTIIRFAKALRKVDEHKLAGEIKKGTKRSTEKDDNQLGFSF